MADTFDFDVFLSYHWRDHAQVEALARRLHKAGVRPFLDRWYLVPGTNWLSALEKNLARCKSVAVCLGAEMGPWQQREQYSALERQVAEERRGAVFPVIPVLLPGAEAPLGFLRQITWVDFRLSLDDQLRFKVLVQAIRGQPPGPDVESVIQQAVAEVCPFRGLLPFREQDAAFYYGRSAAIEQLVATITHRSLVLVVGASGSGKSSVARAGLLPRLRTSRSPVWEIATLVPTDRPLHALAAVLLPLLEPDLSEVVRLGEINRLAGQFVDGSTALRDVVDRVLAKQPGTERLMLVVDQWEELFTLTHEDRTRQRFIDGVLEATQKSKLSVVLTVRGDFFGRAITGQRALSDRLQSAQVNLGPMTPAELRQAIEEPAHKVGLRFEPGLVEAILADARGEPGNLPLLEFVLRELWEQREGGLLLKAAYEAMGRLQGAIAQKADALYRQLVGQDPQAERRIRGVFLRLVRPGEGEQDTRRRAVASEFGPGTAALIQQLSNERLLVTSKASADRTETVEVAHEALIQNWQQLRDWISADRQFLMWQQRLNASASEWEAKKRSADLLLRGLPLAEARDWRAKRPDGLSELEGEFIRASTKRRLVTRVAAASVTGVISVVMLATGAWIVYQTRVVARQTSLVLAVAAEAAADRNLFDESLRLGVLATRSSWLHPAHPSAAASLARAADGSTLRTLIKGHTHDVFSARFSPDGKRIVTTSDKTARVWDADSGRPLGFPMTHGKWVTSASFSPDGKLVVTASCDNSARVWDANTGKPLGKAMTHDACVVSASFSPDSKRVVTASEDKTARVWDADSGRPLGSPMTDGGGLTSASFGPDGKRVVTANCDNARVWDADTGKPLGEPMMHDSCVDSASFSPDGKRVVTASQDKTARVWDADNGRPLGLPMTHSGRVSSASFSPDGKRVVTSSSDATARVWDADTGKPLGFPMMHSDDVTSASFSPDGKRVVTASSDTTARVWDADSGNRIGLPMAHDGVVYFASFSPDGKRVVTASEDATARVWDANTGKPVGEPTYGQGVTVARSSEDGKRVVTLNGKTARVWDADAGKPLGEPITLNLPFSHALFSPDGKRVLLISVDHMERVWDADRGKLLVEAMTHCGQGNVGSATFSPDSKRVVTLVDETARVWDADTGESIGKPMMHKYCVATASFSQDGKRVLTATVYDEARVWDADTGKPLSEPMMLDSLVSPASLSPDGKRVVTVPEDNPARIWDTDTGKPLGEPITHDGEWVRSANFSPDSKRVVTAAGNKTALVWDADTGKRIGLPLTHDGAVYSASFSPDGNRIVTISDKTALVWDADTGKPLGEPMTPGGKLYSARFSPDGKRIVTASEDKTARVWDADTGKPLGEPMTPGGKVYSARFSPDGKRVVTEFEDYSKRLWYAVWDVYWPSISRTPNLIDEVCQRKLHGEARKLTESDIRAARILSAERIGEDVCVDAP
ncbi:TIR domain-containing protein (plasmid) [Caballeronia sp. NK8]|uniref:nSTAND1 domain-containing NTPase n=1 Tax=Caballeronia sp. NK8 TaxID=140098 RepID=UPI001BB6CD85|nr:TIR domain-containing protein [Caballeronia sp. NK8]BCQ29990.1 TIR domain-containing protein [Caballeronia sp. NK8]